MSDEITQKHLSRARVRGAPSSIPGASGLVGSYGFEETQRQAVRALAIKLSRDFSIAEVREGAAKLAQLAAVSGLTVLEGALIALDGDPTEVVPHEWSWKLLLAVRGPAKADEAAGVTVDRLFAGSYLETVTHGGFPDLRNLYTFFLGHFLPQRRQELTRPVIYHRVLEGIDRDDPAALTLAVFLPFSMTLKEPARLLTSEEL